jgi:hypothetical protein
MPWLQVALGRDQSCCLFCTELGVQGYILAKRCSTQVVYTYLPLGRWRLGRIIPEDPAPLNQ